MIDSFLNWLLRKLMVIYAMRMHPGSVVNVHITIDQEGET